ncbi:CsgG/HfaB family protein [Selenomonas ruminantium]|uniref:Curli production assembly/transport component CsgG n=1 Tax=Selenomonas ruminantium TaxID=971 RepID=A0A1H0R9I4_SELRU|nr:CsgG/HfaB family protein [Selenomonas ruminantium]SDP26203.1 Curli production assembly/transport component CsgG [Selenomonas ruminantium]
MNRGKWLLLLVLVLVMIPSMALAKVKGIDDYPRVAVLPLQNKAAENWHDFGDYAGSATDNLAFELNRTMRFECIEREALQKLMDEHSLNMTGMVDRATAAEIGRLSGADYLVLGSVASLTAKSSGAIMHSGRIDSAAGLHKNKVAATVLIRVVDVETGRIVLYGRGKGKSDSSAGAVAAKGNIFMLGSVNVSDEQCENAIEKAVKEAIHGKEGILSQLDGKSK